MSTGLRPCGGLTTAAHVLGLLCLPTLDLRPPSAASACEATKRRGPFWTMSCSANGTGVRGTRSNAACESEPSACSARAYHARNPPARHSHNLQYGRLRVMHSPEVVCDELNFEAAHPTRSPGLGRLGTRLARAASRALAPAAATLQTQAANTDSKSDRIRTRSVMRHLTHRTPNAQACSAALVRAA